MISIILRMLPPHYSMRVLIEHNLLHVSFSDKDSIKGIYNTLADQATISQHAGGIGLHIHNIRSTNSFISIKW